MESERNRYDVLVGKLEREVRSDPVQQRDLDAMREKARLTHNQLRKAPQELSGSARVLIKSRHTRQLFGLDQPVRPIPHPAAGRDRKREDLHRAGVTLWGYGGALCHGSHSPRA